MGLLTDLLGDGNATFDLWLGQNDWYLFNGAPVRAAATTSRWGGWLFDAAAYESIVSSPRLPASWATIDVDLYWTNEGAGSGNVDWELDYGFAQDGDNLTTDQSAAVPAGVQTAPAQDVLEVTRLASGVSVTQQMMYLRLARRGTDASDTLANDARALGVLITKAS